MPSVNDLHPKAMDLAEEAFRLQQKGKDSQAKRLFLQALELEREAALSLEASHNTEPSRSILFRSAASLAFNAKDYEEAERLVAHGLSGYPPLEIKEELKNLYEDINFYRHLHTSGIELSTNQWQMSIQGNAVSFGGTSVEPLMSRVERVTSLFYRTVERMLGVDYRITGSSRKEVKDAYGLYVNAFAPGSFAVAFQIGAPNAQLELIDHKPRKQIEPDSVVDELVQCLELWENGKAEKLKERIDSEVYYENFIGIAKQIAPDGDDVKFVGFKSIRRGREKTVALRKSRVRLRQTPEESSVQVFQPGDMQLTGILKYASTPLTKQYGTVHIADAEGNHSVRVPISLMKDVVQPYYEESVVISAVLKGDHYYLEEIFPKK